MMLAHSGYVRVCAACMAELMTYAGTAVHANYVPPYASWCSSRSLPSNERRLEMFTPTLHLRMMVCHNVVLLKMVLTEQSRVWSYW
jgi:hypothetical protein